jgi:hypothetical protein
VVVCGYFVLKLFDYAKQNMLKLGVTQVVFFFLQAFYASFPLVINALRGKGLLFKNGSKNFTKQ